ncbi:MAG TPA: DUF4149 domain-containing protein [Candidatus Saccharimonadales bacterium]|nr:DUF4149 domain-containing protein [Candidatus Saccharimonadales bacterium]
MDTLYFDVLQFVYHLALAVLVGGALVLGSAAAPGIFRTVRSRAEAGTIFGAVLARYEQLAVLSVVAVVLTSVLKFAAFEDLSPGPRLYARWVALGLLVALVLYGSVWAGPVARAIRARTPEYDDLPEAHPARREFAQLHRSASKAMRVAVVIGLVALFLS